MHSAHISITSQNNKNSTLYTASLSSHFPTCSITPTPHRSRVPARVKKKAMPVTMKGALSTGPEKVMPPAFLLALGEAEGTAEPEPGVASPELVEPLELPAFCEPSPFRPGPVPAPLVKY